MVREYNDKVCRTYLQGMVVAHLRWRRFAAVETNLFPLRAIYDA